LREVQQWGRHALWANRRGLYHRRKEGKLIVNDFTGFMPEHKKWGEARDNGRLNILCQYECADGRKEIGRPTKLECLKDEEGRIYLNHDDFTIRKLNHIPHPAVSVILEREMEAISRLNLNIGDLDYSDRMAPVIELRRWLSTSVVLEIDKCNVPCCGRKQSLMRQQYTTE
jgi:hypothetical protein